MTGFRVSRSRLVRNRSRRRRPVHLRQGDERRPARRRVRRPRRGDGAAGPARARCIRPARCRATRWRWRPGLATLRAADDAVYARAGRQRRPARPVCSPRRLTEAGVAHQVQRAGNMLSVFFAERPVHRLRVGARPAETWRFPPFFHALLDARRLPAAQRLRGVVRLGGARRRRVRPDRRRPARCGRARPPRPRTAGGAADRAETDRRAT